MRSVDSYGGMSLQIRALAPGDAESFQAFVRELSAEARLNRFLVPLRELAPELAAALTQPDQRRHVALAATADGRIVGEGRYVMLGDSGRAEFALAVADDWQRQGVGARLLAALTATARRAGLRALEGDVLRSNQAMLRFVRRAGFHLEPCAGDARLVVAVRELERLALAA